MDYSAVFQYSARLPLLRKLQTLQNLFWIILKLPSRTNVDQHHMNLGIFHTNQRRDYFLMNLMFQLYRSHNMRYRDERQLQTRVHDGPIFRPPTRCTSVFMKSFLYHGMITWNQLPITLRRNDNHDIFKLQLKELMREREAGMLGEWSVVSGAISTYFI